MKQFLETLARIPGVRIAALATPDGVPIWHLSHSGSTRQAPASAPGAQPQRGEGEAGNGPDVHALAALATSWVAEVARSTSPLSWEAPGRLVLRAARGTLIVQDAPGAILVVLLEGGVRPEDLRLPMDSVVARMQRHLRSIERAEPQNARGPAGVPGALPSRDANPAVQAELEPLPDPGDAPCEIPIPVVPDAPGPLSSGD